MSQRGQIAIAAIGGLTAVLLRRRGAPVPGPHRRGWCGRPDRRRHGRAGRCPLARERPLDCSCACARLRRCRRPGERRSPRQSAHRAHRCVWRRRSTSRRPSTSTAPCRWPDRSIGASSSGRGRASPIRRSSRRRRFARSICTARVARWRPSRPRRRRSDGRTSGEARAVRRAGSTARGSSTTRTPRPASCSPAARPRLTCGDSPRRRNPMRWRRATSCSSVPPPEHPTTSACTSAVARSWRLHTPARLFATSRSPPEAGTASGASPGRRRRARRSTRPSSVRRAPIRSRRMSSQPNSSSGS